MKVQKINFQILLSGESQKTALQNFIASELHPRFVYFSDYKKIYGNINLNEYLREEKGDTSRFHRIHRGI